LHEIGEAKKSFRSLRRIKRYRGTTRGTRPRNITENLLRKRVHASDLLKKIVPDEDGNSLCRSEGKRIPSYRRNAIQGAI